MNFLKFFILFLVLLFLTSCRKTAPQLPSNKGTEVDSDAVAMVKVNENLAEKENQALEEYVKKTGIKYTKSGIGFWFKRDKTSNGQLVVDSLTYHFSLTTLALNEKVIKKEEITARPDKKTIPVGLAEGLKLMKEGESATFIVPWFLAYGLKGDAGNIKSYQSFIFKVEGLKQVK